MATNNFDLTAAPRAVLREINRVFGARFGDATANARAAVFADRERARERAELSRMLDAARRSGLDH